MTRVCAWLPGCLPGVVQVQVDWDCPREHVQVARVDGEVVFRASGFARPIPGVDPRHNLHGVSFAVANVSGLLARALSVAPPSAVRDPIGRLERYVGGHEGQVGLVGQTGRSPSGSDDESMRQAGCGEDPSRPDTRLIDWRLATNQLATGDERL